MSGTRRLALAGAAMLLAAPVAPAQAPTPPPPIADNSFLVEEAYNQEPGVVQHISGLLWRRKLGAWLYAFTDEWPVGGRRNQLSLTVPVERSADVTHVTAVGDVALNYRYQLVGPPGLFSAAPRLSLLLPTGTRRAGLGAGGLGFQVNLPASITLGRGLVAHLNAGATLTPRARNVAGERATTTAYNLGGSAIWLARPAFNVLMEVAWSRSQEVVAPGATTTTEELLVSPGVRWAHNFPSGLQIVPGVAFPFGVGPSRGDHAVFFYLSFEHPLRRSGG